MSEIKRYFTYALRPFVREDVAGRFVLHADHLAAVEAAVMAEREACAALAQKSYETGYDYSEGGCLHDVIRARTAQPAEGSK